MRVLDWLDLMFLGKLKASRIQAISDGTPSENDISVEWFKGKLDEPLKLGPNTKIADLYMPKALAFERIITAPKKARRNFRRLAELDLVQKTPFNSSDIDWTLGELREEDGQIAASQYLLRKEDLANWESRFSEEGVTLRDVYISDGANHYRIAECIGTSAKRIKPLMYLNLSLLGLATTLAFASWLYPAWIAKQDTSKLKNTIDSTLEQSVTLRQEVESLRLRDQVRSDFTNKLLRKRPIAEVLREVTIALNDDIWIETFQFGDHGVVLTGQTQSSAADVVIGLTNRKMFVNPRISGPVARTASGAEKFQISFGLMAGGGA